MYYRMYLLRKNGAIDEFTSPDGMSEVKEMVKAHSTPHYAILETIRTDDREVAIAREM